MITFYGYKNCSTCSKAKKYLGERGQEINEIDITVQPPSKAALKSALADGAVIKELFNRSGLLYREMKMKDKMGELSEKELIDLLSRHGKLVKRPFITDGKKYVVGFKPEEIDKF